MSYQTCGSIANIFNSFDPQDRERIINEKV